MNAEVGSDGHASPRYDAAANERLLSSVGPAAPGDDGYRTLAMMSPDGISVVDRTGLIIDCNEQFARLLGYDSASELIGRLASEFAPPLDYANLYQQAAAGFRSGRSIVRGIHVELVRRDGSSCSTEYSIAQVAWTGAPAGLAYIASIRDISAQTLALAALAQRQASLEEEVQQRLLDLQAEIVERTRLEGTLRQRVRELSSIQALGQLVSVALPLDEIIQVYLARFVNLARVDTAELWLLKGQELKFAGISTHSLREAVPEEARGAGERVAHLALDRDRPVCLGDSSYREYADRDERLEDETGWIAGLPLRSAGSTLGVLVARRVDWDEFASPMPFLEMAADMIATRLHNALLHAELQQRAAGLEETVSERTREVQTERDRTQAILETLGESVLVVDLEGTILFANPATVSLTGYTRDEILNQPLWAKWSEQTLARSWAEAQRAVAGGQAWHGEIVGIRKDGSPYNAALTATPLYDLSPDGVPIGSVWVQRDITIIKEAERLKDQFVSNVSHELRTPISVIALSCDNLAAFGDRLSPSERWEMIEEIHEQAHLLGALAEEILRISQIDSGRIPSSRSQVDLARLMLEETERQRQIAQKRCQQVTIKSEPNAIVMGNEIQLRQVIRNLLENAIKFTPPGGQIVCTCSVQEFPAEAGRNNQVANATSCAVLEITDNGIGIAASELPLIFGRFYRVRQDYDAPGTGLGLSIAQELVKQHGGWISVTSTPGLGSTFSVYLPAIDSARVQRD